ncbi:MAG: pitrilysin family protein [Clostridia bacterium]|nr:pitrilysin family protein [Clostridia bacterium]
MKMQVIENLKVKEELYIEKLENGLTVMIIPKHGIQKKYVIWGTNYGSNDNKFIVPGEEKVTEVPNGVAHFLEHKLFEQENGTNSLDTLTALGVNANAYTTNDHTAYLFECTDNFYEALDELMDYVQHPYFTDENVEKEKGIIGQEIMMYDDYPDWQVYLNAMKAMYHENPIKIDITGTIETISHIDKEILYKCYKTFYNPSNMALVVAGDFKPEKILEEIKNRLVDTENQGEIKRIYTDENESIVQEKIEKNFEVSRPLFTIGIKDNPKDQEEIVKKHIAIEILMNLILGRSSELYKKLYDEGIISGQPSLDYEFGQTYAHVLITGQSTDPEKIYQEFKEKVQQLKEQGINELEFERIKKLIYGGYVKEYNDIQDISRMFLADYFKGINSFDYLEEIESINIKYLSQILTDIFKEEKMILSVVRS